MLVKNNNNIIKGLFFLSLIFLSATNVFIVGINMSWLPLNILASMALILFITTNSIFRGKLPYISFGFVDLFYLLFLLLVTSSTLLFSDLDSYNFRHLLSFFIPYLVYFKLYEYMFKRYFFSFRDINKYIFFGVLLASFISIIEFVYGVIFRLELIDLIPFMHSNSGEYGVFFRSQSLTHEPNHFGLYLSIFAPLSIIIIKEIYLNNKVMAIMLGLSIVTAIFTTFSASLFFIVCIDLLFCIFYLFIQFILTPRRAIIKAIVFVLFIVSLAICFLIYTDSMQTVLDKIFLQYAEDVEDSRAHRWSKIISNIDDYLFFGRGAAQYILDESIGITAVNLWLQLILEAGILGLLSFLTFLSIPMYLFYRRHGFNSLTIPFYISFVNLIVYYVTVSDYWYPWLWIFVAFILYLSKFQNTYFLFKSVDH